MKKYYLEICFVNGSGLNTEIYYKADETQTILKQQQEVLEFINQKLLTQDNFILHKVLIVSKNVNSIRIHE